MADVAPMQLRRAVAHTGCAYSHSYQLPSLHTLRILNVSGQDNWADMVRTICSMRCGLSRHADPAPLLHTYHSQQMSSVNL